MRFAGTIATQRPRSSDALFPKLGTARRCARREKTSEVRHIATAHQQPAAIGAISDKLGDPTNSLCLDLGSRRSEFPGTDIAVERRRDQVGKSTDRRRAGGDIPE